MPPFLHHPSRPEPHRPATSGQPKRVEAMSGLAHRRNSMSIKKELQIGGRTLSLETGAVARQANGACVIRYGDTVVLATACFKDGAVLGDDTVLAAYLDRLLPAATVITPNRHEAARLLGRSTVEPDEAA